jgi:hypothetical protein
MRSRRYGNMIMGILGSSLLVAGALATLLA